MNFYRDTRIKIDSTHLHIKGVLIPQISNITLSLDEIESIKPVSLGFLEKFNLIGTHNFNTWWCFDALRPLRKKGIIVELKTPIGPFQAVGFTPEAFDEALTVLTTNFQALQKPEEPKNIKATEEPEAEAPPEQPTSSTDNPTTDENPKNLH